MNSSSAHLDSDSSSGEFEKSRHMQALFIDQHAWPRFINLYSPLIRHWVYRRGVSRSDIDNVVQETFTRLLTAIKSFSSQTGSGKFRCWLRAITNNIVNDHFRKNGGDAFGGSIAMDLIHQIPSEDSSVGGMFDSVSENIDEDVILYRQIMDWLEANERELNVAVFRLLVVEEKAAGDVATQFGIARSRVYQIKSRVLKKIRKEFGKIL